MHTPTLCRAHAGKMAEQNGRTDATAESETDQHHADTPPDNRSPFAVETFLRATVEYCGAAIHPGLPLLHALAPWPRRPLPCPFLPLSRVRAPHRPRACTTRQQEHQASGRSVQDDPSTLRVPWSVPSSRWSVPSSPLRQPDPALRNSVPLCRSRATLCEHAHCRSRRSSFACLPQAPVLAPAQ